MLGAFEVHVEEFVQYCVKTGRVVVPLGIVRWCLGPLPGWAIQAFVDKREMQDEQ